MKDVQTVERCVSVQNPQRAFGVSEEAFALFAL